MHVHKSLNVTAALRRSGHEQETLPARLRQRPACPRCPRGAPRHAGRLRPAASSPARPCRGNATTASPASTAGHPAPAAPPPAPRLLLRRREIRDRHARLPQPHLTARRVPGMRAENLPGMPWRVASALQRTAGYSGTRSCGTSPAPCPDRSATGSTAATSWSSRESGSPPTGSTSSSCHRSSPASLQHG